MWKIGDAPHYTGLEMERIARWGSALLGATLGFQAVEVLLPVGVGGWHLLGFQALGALLGGVVGGLLGRPLWRWFVRAMGCNVRDSMNSTLYNKKKKTPTRAGGGK